MAGNLEYLQKSTFLCIVNHYQDAVWLMEQTVLILATRSDAVDSLNKEPLKISEVAKEYKSVDRFMNADEV